MTHLHKILSDGELKFIPVKDALWLSEVFSRFEGFPNLHQIWELMDKQWELIGCDQNEMDFRIGEFYGHTVWLLNGLFIEQDSQSIKNRILFKNWIVGQSPARIAELGGGFGGLARMVGDALPKACFDIIEPHPIPLAIARAELTHNVRYRAEMNGDYDVLVATDVFEHVPDPLQLLYETAQHLRIGGSYLIANCFQPVIRCHLPQTFHLRHTWDLALQAMGLEPSETIAYGRVYIRGNILNLEAARLVERKSIRIWPITKYVPNRLSHFFVKSINKFKME